MRIHWTIASLICAAGAAVAQPAPPPDASAPPPPQAASPGAPGAYPAPRPRPLARDRFAAANVTHDGRLTFEQAQSAGWRPIVNHFGEIDRDHKGYVTLEDIREWFQARKAARAQAPAPGTPPY